MGSCLANISNSISPTAQALFDELCTAYIAPLDFPDLIISLVGVSAAIIAVHLLLEMVRDLKQMTKQKTKSKWLGVRRDFSTEVEKSRTVHVPDLDAALAEELQFQEALLVSLFTAPTVNEASSSEFASLSTALTLNEASSSELALLSTALNLNEASSSELALLSTALNLNEASSSELALLSTALTLNDASSSVQGEPFPKSFCEICLEDKGKWQMIEHEGCSHSFCSECMSKHIIARVEANMLEVNCPGINCRSLLNASHYRHLVPKETLVRWDEAVCKSMYVDSQKLYCPYRDCSAMLVNDTGEAMGKSTCPLCKRSFCAACQVPWHSEFTCKKFKKLNTQKKKEDAMVMTLAKKKHWQKCPQCKMLVEKSEGCIHMTCRCNHQFCYRCGRKWSSTHEACYFKLGRLANRTFGKLLVQ
ncbi:E3 ubiquitin-protein ligase ARIH2-like isoform X2 [Ipomoea triloba]|uniref:E3 ubiquitin-protein ligase ARIH2-like isoform X2 n=1 Tax=Ipomoea triloba TaxID=35885 RepID=UPI00125CDB2A|nr:E3 ubiquitin-protein ligase ARIH2-like isoform X2 [Ipomoea triloba]